MHNQRGYRLECERNGEGGGVAQSNRPNFYADLGGLQQNDEKRGDICEWKLMIYSSHRV